MKKIRLTEQEFYGLIKENVKNVINSLTESYNSEYGEYGFPYYVTYKKGEDEDGEEIYHVEWETSNGTYKEDLYDYELEDYLGKDVSLLIQNGFGKENKDGSFTINNLQVKNVNNVEEVNDLAVKIFGETYSFGLAGYLLTDGRLLDFSQGQGYRTEDHRKISIIDGMDMNKFMNLGNIRIMPESPGIYLSRKPTSIQFRKLVNFISKYGRKEGCFYVDIVDDNGNNLWNREYTNIYADMILQDIENFFDNGGNVSEGENENNDDY